MGKIRYCDLVCFGCLEQLRRSLAPATLLAAHKCNDVFSCDQRGEREVSFTRPKRAGGSLSTTLPGTPVQPQSKASYLFLSYRFNKVNLVVICIYLMFLLYYPGLLILHILRLKVETHLMRSDSCMWDTLQAI